MSVFSLWFGRVATASPTESIPINRGDEASRRLRGYAKGTSYSNSSSIIRLLRQSPHYPSRTGEAGTTRFKNFKSIKDATGMTT